MTSTHQANCAGFSPGSDWFGGFALTSSSGCLVNFEIDTEAFSRLLDKIVHSYSKDACPTDDSEFQNHILFLQHTQTYLLLKYSIKHADLSLLHQAIDHCCLYFHGLGQSRYVYEILYLQYLTLTHATTPEL